MPTITVPAALQPVMPYLKFAVAVLGVIASAVIAALGAGTPAFVYVIVSVIAALGVYTVPNTQVQAIFRDGMEAVTDVEAAASDVKAGSVASAGADLSKAVQAADGAVKAAEPVVKAVEHAPTVEVPAVPPVLPSQVPTPPQPVKPADPPAAS